jgi:hypothetical protein
MQTISQRRSMIATRKGEYHTIDVKINDSTMCGFIDGAYSQFLTQMQIPQI